MVSRSVFGVLSVCLVIIAGVSSRRGANSMSGLNVDSEAGITQCAHAGPIIKQYILYEFV